MNQPLWQKHTKKEHQQNPGRLITAPFSSRIRRFFLSGAERLKAEMEGIEAAEDEPLIEKISTDWVRLNLRPAKAKGMSAEEIAWYLVRSAE